MSSIETATPQKIEGVQGYPLMAGLPSPCRVRDGYVEQVQESPEAPPVCILDACPWDSLAQFLTLPELEWLACASTPLREQLTIEEKEMPAPESGEEETSSRKMLAPLLVLKLETAEIELNRISLGNVKNIRIWNYKCLDMLCEGLEPKGGPQMLRSLERIALKGCPMTSEVISSFIFPAFSHTQLKHLNLEKNFMTDDQLCELVKSGALDAGCLESMNLRQNRIGTKGVEALASSPCCRALKWVNLKLNQVGDDGAVALAEMLKGNSSMSLLNLRRQTPPLKDRSALAFASMLECNSSLEQLRFRQNHIEDEGVAALAAAVPEHVRRLQSFLGVGARFELDLEQNRVRESGARCLLDALNGMPKNVKVEMLVHGNRVKREALTAPAEAGGEPVSIDSRLIFESKAEGLLW